MYVFSCRQREKYIHAMLGVQPHASGEMYETLKKLLESYEQELFPYQEKQEWNQRKSISEIMEKQMTKGPMVVEAMNYKPEKKKS